MDETRDLGTADPAVALPLTRGQIEKPRPLSSLTAAASRIKSAKIRGGSASRPVVRTEDWQEDAWDMFDLVGEQRFLASTLANRLGQARFFVGKAPSNPTEDVEEVEDSHPANDVLGAMRGSGPKFAQLITRLGINLTVPGDGYIVGVPKTGPRPIGPARPPDPSLRIPADVATSGETPDLALTDLSALDWRMASNSEVEISDESRVRLRTGDGTAVGSRDDGATEYALDEVVLIRIWRSHPRYWWRADSPTRASIPVLKELVGLTQGISAQIDSRLAGAGVFIVPQSAVDSIKASRGAPLDETEDVDDFTAALIDAMITPIKDRDSASAVVPLVVTVPDESVGNFKHISFSTPLDSTAQSLREEAIRRLALGQDCPPELLLGVSSMNHWGAWLVREDVVTTHLEPPLALICDAITTQYLWPALIASGMAEDEAHDLVVWYDVDHLIVRPDRSQDAKDLHSAGVITDEALRDAAGFDETDAPAAIEGNPPHIELAIDLIRQAPLLAEKPGLASIARQIKALLADEIEQDDPAVVANERISGPGTAPPADGSAPPPPPADGSGDGPPPSGQPTTPPPSSPPGGSGNGNAAAAAINAAAHSATTYSSTRPEGAEVTFLTATHGGRS